MKRFLAFMCCVALALSLVACSDKENKKSDTAIIAHSVTDHKVFKYSDKSMMKIAFIYIGEITDNGYNQAMDNARVTLVEKGYNCVYSENIPDNELCEKEMQRLIEEQGVNVFVLTSYNYTTYAKRIASINPEIAFLQYSEEDNIENLGTFCYKSYELKYLLGIVAGKKAEETGNKNIGYVAAVQTPLSYREVNAFALGVKSVCSDAKIYLEWIHSWGDYQLEKNSAENLINNYNCGILSYNTDTLAVPEICQQKGVYVVANSMKAKEIAPDYCIAIGKPDYDEYIVVEIEKFLADGWYSRNKTIGLDADGNFTYIDVPENSAENTSIAVDMMRSKIQNSEIEIFSGPLNDNYGLERVPDDKNLNKSDIKSMNWLIEGVTEV